MESLQLRRSFRNLSCINKLFNSEHPHYLFKLIPSRSSSYVTRNIHNIPFFKTWYFLLYTFYFFKNTFNNIFFLKNSFFPPTIIRWNKLDHNIRNSNSFNIFRKSILKFIRPSANSLFNCNNPKGIKFITRLPLGLSHLRDQKLKHSFQDSLNPFCNCSLDIESTAHFLPHCPTYITERRTLLSTITNIDNNFLDLCEPVLIRTLLFGSNSFDTYANTNVLNATIEQILSTKRFDEPLFHWKQKIFKQCYESVNFVFIAAVTYVICKFLFCSLRICFIPGILTISGIWWLSYSVWYNLYIKMLLLHYCLSLTKIRDWEKAFTVTILLLSFKKSKKIWGQLLIRCASDNARQKKPFYTHLIYFVGKTILRNIITTCFLSYVLLMNICNMEWLAFIQIALLTYQKLQIVS